MKTYAIVHTFPNGETIGDGYLTRGHGIARFYGEKELSDALESMRNNPMNAGHTFEAVAWERI